MRLRIVAALLLEVAGCSGADETSAADQASPTQTAPDATVSETPAVEGADGALTILSGAAAGEGDTDIGVFDFYPSEVQVRPGDILRFENGSGAIPVPHTVTLGTGADVGTNLPPPVAEGVGQDEAVQTQTDLDAAAQQAIDADLADGREAASTADAADRPPDVVQAGAEQGAAVVTRFFPTELTVPAGTTVTWVNEGNDPHVVSFGGDVGPHDPENFAPPTIPPGDDYTGGPAISGVFGGPPFPSTTYALRFPEAGRYAYLCPIHPAWRAS